ncbi:MAG: cellobiose phosphorylase [Gemmiger sp.]|nr:cellobiose phosphorylase [Gemmiger sp.]
MEPLQFLNPNGDFTLRKADATSGLYFPLVNAGGMISSITPTLAGDCKTGQNTYLLAPASNETLHESRATRNFWLCIPGKQPWSAAGQSAWQRAALHSPEAEEVTLTAGLLWQRVLRENKALGVQASILSFVPAGGDRVELMQLTIKNTGTAPLAFTPVAAIPLYGRSADNIRDHRQVTSLLQRLCVLEQGVELHSTLTFDERGHKPGTVRYTVLGCDATGAGPVGCLGSVQSFVGEGGSYDCPAALAGVKPTWLHPGDTAEGCEMVAALRFADCLLAPGAETQFTLVLGIDCAGEEYLAPGAVARALEATKAAWQQKCSVRFTTGNPGFDAWMRWVTIQPELRRICGCSFLPHHDYSRGGRGWRDLWQDCLALLLTEPETVREDLLDYFAGVRVDGTNATIIGRAPGEFVADRNNIVRVWMDHGFWPLLTVNLYLQQSGDYDFLMQQRGYFCDQRLARGEKLDEHWDTAAAPRKLVGGKAVTGSILEHLLLQNVAAFFDVGAHGMLRLRGADWNDALDMATQNGESVAFTAAYAGNLLTLAHLCSDLARRGTTTVQVAGELCDLLATPAEQYQSPASLIAARKNFEQASEAWAKGPRPVATADLQRALTAMATHLQQKIRAQELVTDGADRSWFNSYYDENGTQVEGNRNNSHTVRMMLTGQVFTVLSGTATPAQVEQIIRAADWYLYSPVRGGYCLNTDFGPYGKDTPPLGRMFGFAYGHKENGAVFCHMAVMYAYALYSRGFAEAGNAVLGALYRQCAHFAASRIYPGIPEYFDPQGRGMYPYLTGAASWLLLCMLTQSFGVRGCKGDLLLAPALTAQQFDAAGNAVVECSFAGRALRILYHNPHFVEPDAYKAATATLAGESYPYNAAVGGVLIPRAALLKLDENETLTMEVTIHE